MIDGLRLVAATLVLLSHVAFWTGAAQMDFSGPLLARGDSGVAIFFALCAFLLLRPWLRTDTQVDLRRYAVHRFVRIMPAYWLALIAVLAVLFLRTGHLGEPVDVVAHVLLLQGYTGADYQAFTQTWSLTTEVTFYALLPLVAPILAHWVRRSVGGALARLAVIGVAGVLMQAVAIAGSRAQAGTWPGVLATSVAGHALWFTVGAVLAVLSTPAGRRWITQRPWWRGVSAFNGATPPLFAAVLVYALLSLPAAGPVGLEVPTVAQAVVKEVGYALLAGLLLLAATRPAHDEAARTLHHAPALRLAGDISYAVFLWHVLMLQVLYSVAGWPLFSGGFGWMLFAVVVFTAMVAYASTALVERPLMARWASPPSTAERTQQPARQG